MSCPGESIPAVTVKDWTLVLLIETPPPRKVVANAGSRVLQSQNMIV